MANCIILTGGTWNKPEWGKIQRSVGPYRIATALNEAGYSTFVFDYIINFSIDEIKQVLDKQIGPDTLWVGLSSTFFWFPDHGKTHGNGDILRIKEMYWTYDETVQELLSYIKSKNVKIIYGGTKSEFFVGTDPMIDYYVVGLADTSVVPLTDSIKNKTSLLGSEEISPGVFVVDSRAFPEPAMSEIRTPFWNKEFNILPKEGLPIELARGCIFKCKFCTYPLLGKKKGTYLRSADEIRDDLMRNYDAYGTTDYFITDDTVNDDNDKIAELHRAFKTLPFQPRISGFFRLDLINRFPEQADILVDMGLVGVFFGIETMHPESAKSIGKGLHPNKVKDRLYWLTERWKNKVNIGGGIILGLPHDTLEYFDELIKWTVEPDFPMQHLQFYPLHLNNMSNTEKPGMYVSEFNLHPDIYGYEFPGTNNYMNWELPSQGLSYTLVNQVAKEFNKRRFPLNKVAGFEMIKYLNIGIELQDLYDLTQVELVQKYDIDSMNQVRINQYKALLGLR